MMRTSKALYEDFVDEDDGELGVKGEEKSGGNRTNAHRLKHSESEQRRRSKINERFQILRDLIPQNDQKRDKASFLLEVIEYIQFLQEKLCSYEGSYQRWSSVSEPTKLTPWRNYNRRAESVMDPSEVVNCSNQENNVVCSSEMLTNTQSTDELLSSTEIIFKSVDHPFSSATHVDTNVFTTVGTDRVPTQPLDDSASEAEKIASWEAGLFTNNDPHPTHTGNKQEDLIIENRSKSISSTYSQGILNTLTCTLQSSGVDLSHTSISVNLDVRKRASEEATIKASSSKEFQNEEFANHLMLPNGLDRIKENSKQADKRLRTKKALRANYAIQNGKKGLDL